MSDEIFNRFAREYQAYNGVTAKRAGEQLRRLHLYEEFIGKPVEESGAVDLKEYMTFLLEDGISPESIRTYRNMIRAFYTWAWDVGIVDAETLMRVRTLPAPHGANGRGKPRPYSRAEVAQFWVDLDKRWPLRPERAMTYWRNGNSRWQKVWRNFMHAQIEAIANLALFGGLRRIEIWRLSIEELHPDNAYLVVKGKGRGGEPKLREVPYDPAAAEAVGKWLRMRAEMNPRHDSVWLRCINPGSREPMTFERLGSVFSTIGGGYELHRFRHTCATERLRADMPLPALQKFLGHARISETLRYTELVNDDVMRAAQRTEADVHRALRRAA